MKAAGSSGRFAIALLLGGWASAQHNLFAEDRAARNDATAKKAEAVVLREAEKFASCTKALDTGCVIALSDAQGYERLSAPGFRYRESQARYFEEFKEMGSRYTRFELAGAPVIFQKERSLYCFVPYRAEGVIAGQEFKTDAYLIGRSPDGGLSWKFVDGTNLSIEQVRLLIPAYDGHPPLPAVHAE